jgi:hypothetical protein
MIQEQTMFDLDEVSRLLDDTIARGEALTPRSRVEIYEEEIAKALSHNPFEPHVMTNESPYHNPYQYVAGANGGFLPHSIEHLRDVGLYDPDLRPHDNYLTTRRFYEQFLPMIEDRAREFRGFVRALERGDLEKAGVKMLKSKSKSKSKIEAKPQIAQQKPKAPIPDGTIHTFSDGKQYRKQNGAWIRHQGGDMESRLQTDPKAHNEIEAHAQQVGAVNDHMGRRKREQVVIEQAKAEVFKELHPHLKKLATAIGGADNPEVQKVFQDLQQHIGDTEDKVQHPDEPEDHLHDMENELGKKHKVHVHFTTGGNEYKHVFNDVVAEDDGDATTKVTEALSNRFPSAKIHKVAVVGDTDGDNNNKSKEAS